MMNQIYHYNISGSGEILNYILTFIETSSLEQVRGF